MAISTEIAPNIYRISILLNGAIFSSTIFW